MTSKSLSSSEIKFIKDGITQGVRRDGRGPSDLRHLIIKTTVLPLTNGSCRVRNAMTGGDVLCGVKLEVGPISEPTLQVSVDCGTLPRITALGPSEASKLAEKTGKELSDSLAQSLQDAFIDLPLLLPGTAKWVVFVDCVVFGNGGNLLDLLSVACYCALCDLKIPQTTLNEDGTDFEINPDYNSALALNRTAFVLHSTCYMVAGKIITDASLEEELCADCAISATIDRNGTIKRISKLGRGSLPPVMVSKALAHSSTVVLPLFKLLDAEIGAQARTSNHEICLSKR